MDRSTSLPFLVSIVMRAEKMQNRWQSMQWKLLKILPEAADVSVAVDSNEHYVFRGFAINLFVDETPGYFLNLSTDKPCWFVMWRLETRADFDNQEDVTKGREGPSFGAKSEASQEYDMRAAYPGMSSQEWAVPKAITLSYNEAARWMDAGERVDTLELSEEIAGWLAAYTQKYYQPEEKKKRKHPSFEGGEAVFKMAQSIPGED